MPMNRRDLLGVSALLLAGPALSLRAAAKPSAAGNTPAILCWNENPYGPSPAARRAIAGAIGQACRYPSDEEQQDLVSALAQHEGADCGSDRDRQRFRGAAVRARAALRARRRRIHRRGADLPGAARVRAHPGRHGALRARWTRACVTTCRPCRPLSRRARAPSTSAIPTIPPAPRWRLRRSAPSWRDCRARW